MQSYTLWVVVGVTALVGLLIVGLVFARLYKRASAERSFVRTGLGGQKVIMSGGAVVLPIFHEIIPINMNTLKLEVNRAHQDSLITKDRMRVDVIVAFFLRVKPTIEGVATAAQTLGQLGGKIGAADVRRGSAGSDVGIVGGEQGGIFVFRRSGGFLGAHGGASSSWCSRSMARAHRARAALAERLNCRPISSKVHDS